jgi:hypothetical protein
MKGRDYVEDLGIYGKILKWILGEIGLEGVEWSQVA